ncbi:hypothetical protein Tco_1074357 [Tanacetum coccineum]
MPSPCLAQRSFDMALRSSLERIITASGPGFGDWQWRLATLPFAFRGLGVYSAGNVLNYAFLASQLQSTGLQTKLLWHTGIVSFGPIFDDALSILNTSMETNLLCNPSEIAAPKLIKKMADIYFIRVTKNAMLGQTMNETMLYRMLLVKKLISSWLGGCDKPVRPSDMLLYSWDGGLDVCVDVTGSSLLTQTVMADFVPGRAVIDAAHRKCEANEVTLLKRIQKFSMAQDIGTRVAVHIFNMISFAIAKGVGA